MAKKYTVDFPISLGTNKYIDDDYIDPGYFIVYPESPRCEERTGYVVAVGRRAWAPPSSRTAVVAPDSRGASVPVQGRDTFTVAPGRGYDDETSDRHGEVRVVGRDGTPITGPGVRRAGKVAVVTRTGTLSAASRTATADGLEGR
jgi:hypothetical protein